ncbi:MAG: sarcosine oxidase subunit gamma family protein [Ectothiorhodospiraceae bacterium]|jgi:heterotetrameric sarcosine oxidase gamma subunit
MTTPRASGPLDGVDPIAAAMLRVAVADCPVVYQLRAPGRGAGLAAALQRACGVLVPQFPGALVVDGGAVAFHPRAGEWFLALRQKPCRPLEVQDAAAVDVSGGYVLVEMAGEGAVTVLQHADSAADSLRNLRPGRCAYLVFAGAELLVGRLDSRCEYRLLIPSSAAAHVWRWLQHVV